MPATNSSPSKQKKRKPTAIKNQRIQPKASRKGKKRKPKKKPLLLWHWVLIWCGLTGVSIASATAGALLAVSLSSTPLRQTPIAPEELTVFSQDEAIATQSLRLPELTRPVNIMLLGTKVLTSDVDDTDYPDLGYHALVNSFEGLSDTMLVLRFNPEDQRMSVLSIPRDTQANIEGYGVGKINHANSYGGAVLAAKSISNLLGGVELDRYIRVNVQGIEKLIDALGGVTVYVPKDMKYTDHSQHLYIDLKEGEQVLDGEKAMQFLRFRYDGYGDIGRVQRQQTLIRAVLEQALTPGNLVKLPKILSIVQSHIDTNLSVQELIALAGFASGVNRSDMQMVMLPGEFSGDGKNGNTSFWLPHHRRIGEVMAQHFEIGEISDDALTTDPNRVRIAIQDSTGDANAVRSMLEYLNSIGYNRVTIADDWSEPLQSTRIIAQGGDDLIAAEMRSTLGFGEIRVESTGVLSTDITIQLGEDWLIMSDTLETVPDETSFN
ncbi:transcriptional attenuator, LytR family [[Leptolyngbya] sp. PCC 7376]|uniref:LCP family protein n=1 Tax=[Leptolyngbya] sp. PCC 7376 TaxID=111781 RepID=UPI00029F044E|nr:LCP family protein [[Leptolyngbya] sp. PCC 7376]AFY40322.1 transcriptional attenuator, LytR family [[Leptolyngbya] sp. PCC 7376]